MTVRASGRRCRATIRIRRWARIYGMPERYQIVFYVWHVPAPKGHPKPPSPRTLAGSAHTLDQAIADSTAKLHEIYVDTVPEHLRKQQP